MKPPINIQNPLLAAAVAVDCLGLLPWRCGANPLSAHIMPQTAVMLDFHRTG